MAKAVLQSGQQGGYSHQQGASTGGWDDAGSTMRGLLTRQMDPSSALAYQLGLLKQFQNINDPGYNPSLAKNSEDIAAILGPLNDANVSQARSRADQASLETQFLRQKLQEASRGESTGARVASAPGIIDERRRQQSLEQESLRDKLSTRAMQGEVDNQNSRNSLLQQALTGSGTLGAALKQILNRIGTGTSSGGGTSGSSVGGSGSVGGSVGGSAPPASLGGGNSVTVGPPSATPAPTFQLPSDAIKGSHYMSATAYAEQKKAGTLKTPKEGRMWKSFVDSTGAKYYYIAKKG